jgi:hypothetical protein
MHSGVRFAIVFSVLLGIVLALVRSGVQRFAIIFAVLLATVLALTWTVQPEQPAQPDAPHQTVDGTELMSILPIV